MIIAITGVDCSGKTTQIKNLIELYKKKNVEVKSVSLKFKPTVKNLSIYENNFPSNPKSFPPVLSGDYYAMAYNCDFYNHYCSNIAPLLDKDPAPLIISDRYTICYKAFAYAVKAKNEISHIFLDNIVREPDLTICLDLSIDKVLKRISLRKHERFADETYDILNSIIEYYQKHIKDNENGFIIDADIPKNELTQVIFELIESYRNEKNIWIF